MTKFVRKFYLWTCIIFQVQWLIIIFIFVMIPSMCINSIRRFRVKNKIRKDLIKQGLPKENARKIAFIYRDMLNQYTTIRGISKIVKGPKLKQKKVNSSEEEGV